MKRIVMMAIALSGAGFAVHAQTSAKADSLKVVNLQEVQVVSTRATAKTPVAFTNVRKEQISKQNFGQDIPIPIIYHSFRTDNFRCRGGSRIYYDSRSRNGRYPY